MNLFRSEEHIERWLAGREPGATMTATKLSELAHAWWGRPGLARLGAAHARAEPGGPRPPRPHRRVLAPRLAYGGSDVDHVLVLDGHEGRADLHDQVLDGGEDLAVAVLARDDDPHLVLRLSDESVLVQEPQELVAIRDASSFDLNRHWIQYLASRPRM